MAGRTSPNRLAAGALSAAQPYVQLEKRDDRIFAPAANAEELLVMRSESVGKPCLVYHHQPA